MTTEQKNIECAKRDGWIRSPEKDYECIDMNRSTRLKEILVKREIYSRDEQTCIVDDFLYHSSRDAIMPLIEKQHPDIQCKFIDELEQTGVCI